VITTTLASFPSPPQGVWFLGPFPIRAYALCIIIGIIAALVIGDRRWVARGGEQGVIYDIALWAVPFGLIGGRIYHVMTDWQTYFGSGGAGAMAALRIWDGGLGIWGAVAFGGLGAWLACRRRGIPLPAFGDAVAPGIVLAQAIGRLGNYFNQELYGRETTVPWGMEVFYRRDPSGIVDVHSLNGISTGQVAAVVHPTFLYELLWNLLVFAALIYLDRRFRIGHGRLFALYVAGYCVGRFCVELLRDDYATEIAGIRINSFTATFVFIGAIVYFILATKGREEPETLRGREREPLVEEFVEDLSAVAATTGVVAAATVAGREDALDDADENADAADVGELDTEAAEESVADEPADDAAEDVESESAEAVADADVAAVGEVDAEAAQESVADEPADDEIESTESESAEDVEEVAADEPDSVVEAEGVVAESAESVVSSEDADVAAVGGVDAEAAQESVADESATDVEDSDAPAVGELDTETAQESIEATTETVAADEDTAAADATVAEPAPSQSGTKRRWWRRRR
jgi:prolipoprotein diacylglyceryl transferase